MSRDTLTTICIECRRPFAARLFREPSGRFISRDVRCTPCNNADWLRDPVGPGWMPLVAEADQRMAAIDRDYRIVVLKQKLGQLRIVPFSSAQASPAQWDALHAVAAEVRQRSRTICQDCGAPAPLFDSTKSNRTLCPRHLRRRGAPDGRQG